MRSLITVLVLLLWISLSAAVYTVSQDGTGDYTSIQPAIDVSVTGDTVLVYPGRYFENLEVSNGITLASLYLTTGNPDYVHSTIIDGNQTGTCVFIEDSLSDTVTITGLKICNGNGGNINNAQGGGITVYSSSATIDNSIIEHNYCAFTGGIMAWDSSIYFSSVTIRYNEGRFGGLFFEDCYNVEFDPVNLCNIYLNYGETCDIRKHSSEIQYDIELYADTLTVLNPQEADGYFFNSTDDDSNILNDIIIHANYGKIEPVNADLYISPDGDDANSGLSPDDPMQRLCMAMTRIASDSLENNTIYLADGLYSAEANNQHFPVGMRNWVNIEGQSMENTIIECGLEKTTFQCRNSSLRLGFSISNLQFIKNTLPSIGGPGPICLGFGQEIPGDSLTVENILIQNCTTNSGLLWFGQVRPREYYPFDADIHLRNIYLLNNMAGNAISFYSGNVVADNIVIQGHEQIQEGYQLSAVPILYSGGGSLKLINSIITNCINHNIDFSNSPAAIATSIYDGSIMGPRIDIINCTIGNNHSDSYGGGGITIRDGPTEVNFYNTIIYGNTDHEVIAIDDPNINNDYIDVNFYNTVIDPGEVLTGSEVNLYYNLACNDVNPLWYDTGELPYFMQEDSYCIDTGTLTQLDSLIAFLPETDLAGNPRIYNNQIDIGCYEWNPDVGTNEFKIENVKCKIGNYPNPFNPETTISFFTTESAENTEISIYNVKGQRIREWEIENVKSKINSVVWDGKDSQNRSCTSGIYFCRISAGSQVKTQKMLLLK